MTNTTPFRSHSPGETRIGISYEKLCQSVAPGKRILISDGTLSIEVLEILSETELRGRCLNSKSLGPRKNVNLPGEGLCMPFTGVLSAVWCAAVCPGQAWLGT